MRLNVVYLIDELNKGVRRKPSLDMPGAYPGTISHNSADFPECAVSCREALPSQFEGLDTFSLLVLWIATLSALCEFGHAM